MFRYHRTCLTFCRCAAASLECRRDALESKQDSRKTQVYPCHPPAITRLERLCVCLQVWMGADGYGQSSAQLARSVQDATGLRLAGVTLTLRGPSNQHIQTDSEGQFDFQSLPEGEYEGLAFPAMAQTTGTTNMEVLRQKIKADKKLVVAQNLKLTDAEGAAFWPVYDAYQKDLQQINQRLGAVVLAYADAYNKGPVADDVAKKLLEEALAVDDAEQKLKGSVRGKDSCHASGDEGGTLHPDREQDSSGSSATRWLRAFRSSRDSRSALTQVILSANAIRDVPDRDDVLPGERRAQGRVRRSVKRCNVYVESLPLQSMSLLFSPSTSCVSLLTARSCPCGISAFQVPP